MKKPNLNFKPKSYFGPKDLTEHLISRIKSEAVKSRLNQLYRENRYDEVEELLNTYDEEKMDPGLIHPTVYGGNYLDEKNSNESRNCKYSD